MWCALLTGGLSSGAVFTSPPSPVLAQLDPCWGICSERRIRFDPAFRFHLYGTRLPGLAYI